MQFLHHPFMRRSHVCATAAVTCLVLMAASSAWAQQPSAENTANNSQHQVTADQQSSASTARQLTAKIRRSLMADKTLSMDAHNVKIITQNGMVTLKGPVKSEEEKQEVATKAAQAAGGPDKVDNQLTVKGQS
jgi:hyperosmotically inducible protein